MQPTLRSLWLSASLLTAAAVIAACAGDDDLTRELDGSEFWSTEVLEDGETYGLVADSRIVLRFDGDRISANAGCNTIGGVYGISDERLEVSELSMTEMGCDPARHAQDDFVITLLGARPVVHVEGERLSLTSDGAMIRFVDAAIANPARPLIGTTWTVDGFLSGDTASSFATPVDATLTFGEAEAEIFDGCTMVSFPVEVDEGALRFSPQQPPEAAGCEVPAGYRQSVYTAFSRGTLRFEIDGSNLTLTTPDRVGITLRARG